MMSFAVLAIVKATLLCGVAFILSRLCRSTRASIRHLLFVLAFAALVLVPGAGTVLPSVAITVPAPPPALALPTQDMAPAVLSSAGAGVSGSTSPSVSRDTASKKSVTIASIVTAAWLIGVALFLIPILVGFWQVRRMREVATPWINGQAHVEALAPTLGVRRRVDTLLSEGVAGPMTCGVVKPAIILPAAAEQWDKATLKCALRHELEHVARFDFLTHCLSRMVCAAYWFHPLVWVAWRRLRLEAERACDDAVLRENDASDYAALLVSIAQREPAATRRPLLAMAGRGDLAARVAAVLDRDQSRGRIGRRRATGLIATGAIMILGLAPITVARAIPQGQATSAGAPPLTFETASVKRNQGVGTSFVYFTDEADGKPGVGPDGRVQWVIATNVTARSLVWLAYGFELKGDNRIGERQQIDNAPAWVDSDRFDVVAKAPSRVTPQQMPEMLQSLLADRFKLEAHRGSKEFPIYALVLARPDGSLGPQMTRSQMDCSPDAVRARSASANPPGLPGTGDRPTCGMSSAGGRLAGGGVTMAQLIKFLPAHVAFPLSRQVFNRQVVDRTGLSGPFDFTLQWTPDDAAQRLLAALQEQLGLTLDSQLASEPVLIIDKIEPPIENKAAVTALVPLQVQSSTYQRNELVRVRPPVTSSDPHASEVVLRVVGIPSDRIRVDASRVYINDGPPTGFSPEFLARVARTPERVPQVVPDGHYFVMGEQRINQDISEYWGQHSERSLERLR